MVKNKDDSILLIGELLLSKFGMDAIKGLLIDESHIEKTRPKERTAYVRHLRKEKNLFCSCTDGKHEWCTDPEMLLEALDDAGNEMSYSNWHTDKFDRAAEGVIRYCEEHKIPMRFERKKEEE